MTKFLVSLLLTLSSRYYAEYKISRTPDAAIAPRKELRNQSAKSRLHNLETKYATLLTAGKKDEATTAYRALTSALDKAAKNWRHSLGARESAQITPCLGVRLAAIGKAKAN